MTVDNFTFEEVNLMCIYDTGSRIGLMDNLKDMRTHLEPDETELRNLTDSVLEKLGRMRDEEYDQMDLFPDFGL